MPRERKLTLRLEGPPGSGKTTILDKLCAYLEFFDIETIQIDEHVYILYFKEHSIKALGLIFANIGKETFEVKDDPTKG